jgi:hypothetical protein
MEAGTQSRHSVQKPAPSSLGLQVHSVSIVAIDWPPPKQSSSRTDAQTGPRSAPPAPSAPSAPAHATNRSEGHNITIKRHPVDPRQPALDSAGPAQTTSQASHQATEYVIPRAALQMSRGLRLLLFLRRIQEWESMNPNPDLHYTTNRNGDKFICQCIDPIHRRKEPIVDSERRRLCNLFFQHYKNTIECGQEHWQTMETTSRKKAEAPKPAPQPAPTPSSQSAPKPAAVQKDSNPKTLGAQASQAEASSSATIRANHSRLICC